MQDAPYIAALTESPARVAICRSREKQGATMPFYTFLSHGQSATVPSVTFDTFDKDEDALAHGRKLIRENSQYLRVEVMVGDTLIGEEQRGA